jgi:hypothetical protein
VLRWDFLGWVVGVYLRCKLLCPYIWPFPCFSSGQTNNLGAIDAGGGDLGGLSYLDLSSNFLYRANTTFSWQS